MFCTVRLCKQSFVQIPDIRNFFLLKCRTWLFGKSFDFCNLRKVCTETFPDFFCINRLVDNRFIQNLGGAVISADKFSKLFKISNTCIFRLFKHVRKFRRLYFRLLKHN